MYLRMDKGSSINDVTTLNGEERGFVTTVLKAFVQIIVTTGVGAVKIIQNCAMHVVYGRPLFLYLVTSPRKRPHLVRLP